MNLEDHLGDIVRKGRMMSGISRSAAAAAAQCSEAELAGLEETGIPVRELDLARLALVTGLNADKLQSIARGWLPAVSLLSRWHGLQTFVSSGADLSVNCYLIWDEQTKAAALFDTGFVAAPICEAIDSANLQLTAIYITHSHHDHIHALAELRRRFPRVAVMSSSRHAPAAERRALDAPSRIGSLHVGARATPGHAADGVTYVITGWPQGAPAVAVVGDAVFAGSMGRGNDGWELARRKVREEILSLPPETLICPGHGPLTTVAEEIAHNPFF